MSEFRTAKATEAIRQRAADRAADDPVKLDRAVRIVRTALARNCLALDDLIRTPDNSGRGGRVAA